MGFPAYSGGLGGVVAFGGTVSQEGTPTATHSFATPSVSGLNPAATRLYRVEGNQLVVDDLAPYITGSATVSPISTLASLTGSGLGATSTVTIDGVSAPFSVRDARTVDVTVNHLTLGVHTVRVSTPWGTSAAVPMSVTAPTTPTAPRNVTATLGSSGRTVQVGWQTPIDAGGSPIIGYTVTTSPGGATCSAAPSLACDVAGLSPNTAYTFTVAAQNGLGASPPSTPSSPFTTPGPTVPGATTNVIAVGGVGTALVSWTPPANDGWSPITSYQVTATSVPPTVAVAPVTLGGSTTSVQIGGLTAGADYSFRVTATTAVASTTSAPSLPTLILAATLNAERAPEPVGVGGRSSRERAVVATDHERRPHADRLRGDRRARGFDVHDHDDLVHGHGAHERHGLLVHGDGHERVGHRPVQRGHRRSHARRARRLGVPPGRARRASSIPDPRTRSVPTRRLGAGAPPGRLPSAASEESPRTPRPWPST